jgi:hypothetical protein
VNIADNGPFQCTARFGGTRLVKLCAFAVWP